MTCCRCWMWCNVKPDILIGVSGQTGLFTEEIIREMQQALPSPDRHAAL